MVAEFMRFYGYTADAALGEYAVRFFALTNTMMQIKADENIDRLTLAAAAQSEAGGEVLETLRKQSRGLPGVLQEVRTVRK